MSDRIAEIRARVEAATAGPWEASEACPYQPGQNIWDEVGAGIGNDTTCVVAGGAQDEQGGAVGILLNEDAQFIAHAREDVPYLLARIGGLERQLLATAEGQRATLDQLVRVTGERDASNERADAAIAVLRAIRDLAQSDASDKVIACSAGAWAHDALAAASIESQGEASGETA